MRALAALGAVAVLCAALGYYWATHRTAPPGQPATEAAPTASVSVPGPTAPAAVAGPAHGPAPAAPTGTAPAGTVERKAQDYVETLTGSVHSALPATGADHFVTGSQVIGLDSEKVVESLSLRQLKLDPDLAPSSPLTVVKQISQVDLTTPEKLMADVDGDLDRDVEVLVDEQVKTLSVREVLAQHAHAPDRPIRVVRAVDYLQPTTLAELMADTKKDHRSWDDIVRIIRGRYRPDSASVADLLAGIQGVDKDSVFYIHSVRRSDTQGVWGIIHHGLIENFARGMAIRRGKAIDTFRIDIPRNADERRKDNSSSFLGKMIDEKTRSSAVYNFHLGRMTRNPDFIVPGHEIVIVSFSPDELVSIYKHFLQAQAQAHAG